MMRNPLATGSARAAVLAALLALTGVAVPERTAAQQDGLEGSWRGGGSVISRAGQRESAQCRARYRRASASTWVLTATCATPSGRATQTATVRRVGGNTYRGRFHNSGYDVSGTIHVTVGGSRQTVRLTSDAGTASFELRR